MSLLVTSITWENTCVVILPVKSRCLKHLKAKRSLKPIHLVGDLAERWHNSQESGDSWMYPYQRTPMGNPYVSPMYWECIGYSPQESLGNTINITGTLLGVHPIAPWKRFRVRNEPIPGSCSISIEIEIDRNRGHLQQIHLTMWPPTFQRVVIIPPWMENYLSNILSPALHELFKLDSWNSGSFLQNSCKTPTFSVVRRARYCQLQLR